MSTDETDNTNEINDENASKDRKNSRRQRQQLRFVEDEPEDKEPKSPSTFKPPTRASRFLSICEPSIELPNVNLLHLRQLHNQTVDEKDSTELTDEEFDKIPFKIQIIRERCDDLDIAPTSSKAKPALDMPTVIPSVLTNQRRLEIIEEILKKLSQTNVLDEIRRVNAIPYRLPQDNQLQKNVARRIRELTGSDVVILNDHLYMKNLCKSIKEKRQKDLQKKFDRLAANEKQRQLLE
ncbi:unnamed protein product [Adineta ricciae]|uniref:Uncharacterized protein n=1 Tax=Adineta ricciae TaxID=249248 RepID=A0A815V8P0_ADIRI|nr:unnamed protein product [Adineta ricciae]CAF1532667.1 unnamed protein product [Adineta ricciae]